MGDKPLAPPKGKKKEKRNSQGSQSTPTRKPNNTNLNNAKGKKTQNKPKTLEVAPPAQVVQLIPKDKNAPNFALTPKGPLTPPDVNEKSFYALHLGPQETTKLRAGQVLKCTGGKIRVRNADQKGFNSDNSAYVEKGDILAVTGPVVAFNAHDEDGAHFRVFTSENN
jgi:hypothetical protein